MGPDPFTWADDKTVGTTINGKLTVSSSSAIVENLLIK
jgi:hypothetical protein